MADEYEAFGPSIDGPAEDAAIITPNDSTDLANTTRAILCDAAGTVTVDMKGIGTNIALPVQAGWTPVRVTRVYATGTHVPTIVALW